MKFQSPVALAGLCRTPVGRLGGILAPVEPYKLLSHTIKATEERAGSNGNYDEVIVGNVRNSIGNIGRVAALDAGIPVEVPAITVDRQCASSIEAVVLAASKIQAGLAKQIVVGGVESASRCPWMYEKASRPYAYFEPQPYLIRLSTPEVGDPPMGETAELLADEFSITRDAMDEFAASSHQKAAVAADSGQFNDEIVPFANPNRKATPAELTRDECIRPDSTAESLSKLRPVFRKDGRVTAGNSSPLNDGAASGLALSLAEAESSGITPDAYITGAVTVGLDPNRMGLGPAPAIPKLLDSLGLGIDDVDLFEVNEAFAAQVLACFAAMESKGLKIPEEKFNIAGGAIALGHPLGATGLRLITTMAHHLKRLDLRRGVVSLCVGGGQGMAVMIETSL